MSKFKDKRKADTAPKGVPFVKGARSGVLVKLKEEWTKPDEIVPTVYVGPVVNISKIMKFIDSFGVCAAHKQKLRKGLAVTVPFGEGMRKLQFVSAESQSGTFRYASDGLELVTHEGQHGQPTVRHNETRELR